LTRWFRSILSSTLVVIGVSLIPAMASTQAPPPEPPPPAREGSAEFAFIGTTGNSSVQTIGIGGELIVRPALWTVRNKAALLRNKADSELTAETFQYLFRGERALGSRTALFGEYGYRWKLSPTAELTEDARVIGTFEQADDWRVDQTLAIVARLTTLFSLKASNTVRYANNPVVGFQNTDTNTAIALVAKF
jgi:hypothetical protein